MSNTLHFDPQQLGRPIETFTVEDRPSAPGIVARLFAAALGICIPLAAVAVERSQHPLAAEFNQVDTANGHVCDIIQYPLAGVYVERIFAPKSSRASSRQARTCGL